MHYLLGYLREEQGRYQEVLASYRKAVALDPDYINAWKRIEGLRTHVYLTHTDCDAAILNLSSPHPQFHHEQPDLSDVADLRALAETLDTAAKLQAPHPDSTYPLKAATAILEQREKEQAKAPSHMRYLRYQYAYRHFGQSGYAPSASEAISQARGIQAIAQLIDATVSIDAMSNRE